MVDKGWTAFGNLLSPTVEPYGLAGFAASIRRRRMVVAVYVLRSVVLVGFSLAICWLLGAPGAIQGAAITNAIWFSAFGARKHGQQTPRV